MRKHLYASMHAVVQLHLGVSHYQVHFSFVGYPLIILDSLFLIIAVPFPSLFEIVSTVLRVHCSDFFQKKRMLSKATVFPSAVFFTKRQIDLPGFESIAMEMCTHNIVILIVTDDIIITE